VLIKDNGKACLSDFGLSRILIDATGSSYYLTSTVMGSVRWAAPELFEIEEEHHSEEPVVPSPQSDVYSFGSTMLQVRLATLFT
jgi:serine/threonine protein kinase